MMNTISGAYTMQLLTSDRSEFRVKKVISGIQFLTWWTNMVKLAKSVIMAA